MKKQPLLVVVAATTIVAAGYFGLGVKVEGSAPAMISGCEGLFRLEDAVEVAAANVTSVVKTKKGKTYNVTYKQTTSEKAYGIVGQEVIIEVVKDDIDCNGPIDGMYPKPEDEDTLFEMPEKEFDQNGPIDDMFPKPEDKRPIDAKEDEFDRNGPIDGMYPAPTNTIEKNA